VPYSALIDQSQKSRRAAVPQIIAALESRTREAYLEPHATLSHECNVLLVGSPILCVGVYITSSW
jgi:hypothetical protein